jgi:hypothetical protein
VPEKIPTDSTERGNQTLETDPADAWRQAIGGSDSTGSLDQAGSSAGSECQPDRASVTSCHAPLLSDVHSPPLQHTKFRLPNIGPHNSRSSQLDNSGHHRLPPRDHPVERSRRRETPSGSPRSTALSRPVPVSMNDAHKRAPAEDGPIEPGHPRYPVRRPAACPPHIQRLLNILGGQGLTGSPGTSPSSSYGARFERG